MNTKSSNERANERLEKLADDLLASDSETQDAPASKLKRIVRRLEINWEKESSRNYIGYLGKWHLFTFVSDKMGGTLLPQFYGYTERTPTKINCPGGIFQAKKEANKILKEFISEAYNEATS